MQARVSNLEVTCAALGFCHKNVSVMPLAPILIRMEEQCLKKKVAVPEPISF